MLNLNANSAQLYGSGNCLIGQRGKVCVDGCDGHTVQWRKDGNSQNPVWKYTGIQFGEKFSYTFTQ